MRPLALAFGILSIAFYIIGFIALFHTSFTLITCGRVFVACMACGIVCTFLFLYLYNYSIHEQMFYVPDPMVTISNSTRLGHKITEFIRRLRWKYTNL